MANFFICGFTGAGKSTLLNELKADERFEEYQFIDLDELILGQHPRYESLGDLIRGKGFSYFRQQENSALTELSMKDNQIVALGGGTLTEKNINLLKSWNGFWLNTKFETCYERIRNDENRPLAEKSKEDLFELYKDRAVFYAEYDEWISRDQIIGL